MNLKVKTGSGEVAELQVEAILEVDGVMYRPADETEYLTHQVARLAGRLDTIEAAIFGQRPQPEGEPQ